MPLLDRILKSSDMKTYQSFLLISVDSIKRIDATEALAYLLISSSISRDAKRDWDLKIRTREMMTSFSGIHPFTGDTVYVKVHPVVDGCWLLTVTIIRDRDAGTPSAATSPLSPVPPTRRASGCYKDPIAYYIKNPHNLYNIARRDQAMPRPTCPSGAERAPGIARRPKR